MEGFSIVSYKDKSIYCFDYSEIGYSKEKIIRLIKYATEEYAKLPLKSVLVLANMSNLHVDMDIFNTFKEERKKCTPYEKKIAIIGVKGVTNIAYNFIVNFGQGNNFTRTFDTEIEAKEWLISDN